MENNVTDIPSAVKALRKATELSQQKLADRFGVALTTVQCWESGKFRPSPALLVKLYDLAREARKEDLAFMFMQNAQPANILTEERMALMNIPNIGEYFDGGMRALTELQVNPSLSEAQRGELVDHAMKQMINGRRFLNGLIAILLPRARENFENQ